MRKVLCVMVLLALAGAAFAAGRSEMKRMSVFLSNFTEAGLFNFDMKADFGDGDDEQEGKVPLHLGIPANVTELVRFGIVHNLINNYKSRIRKCTDPDCESGSLTLEARFVNESVRKYFGVDLAKKDLSYIDPEENPSVAFTFDGKLYHFDAESFSEPDEKRVYYAQAEDIDDGGRYTAVSGYIYDKDRPSRKAGTFSAFVWQDKDSWLIISMTTNWNRNGVRD